MKTYPYQTPEGIIQLVEKRELDQLLERLAEARESHLHASARDVQTIQRQSVMLERLAGALRDIAWIKETGQRDYSWTGDTAFAALSAYESANLEPVNPVDVQTIQRQAILLERLADAHRKISDKTIWPDTMRELARDALSAYESANPEPVAHLIAAAPDLLEALKKCAAVIGAPQEGHWATDDEVNDAYDSAVAAIAKAKGGDQ